MNKNKKLSAVPASIMVVDDEKSMLELLTILLEKDGHQVTAFDNPLEALEAFRQDAPDLVIQDLKMPEMSGLELLENFMEIKPGLPVIVITAFSSWDTAVSAMRLGAYDYIKKPFDNEAIRRVVSRAVQQRRYAGLVSTDEDPVGLESIVGHSEIMQNVLKLVTRIARTDSTVLIMGESGTGKELIARAIHFHSTRSSGPFISANCGAFTETLLESELFGHVKGAFTSAFSDKLGLLEVADKGTFFLDEVGDLATATQVKFLRVLEERKFIPVGSTVEKRIDVRFIAATNRNLEEDVKNGRFREDLFYRLNVIPIKLPTLRERREDIPLLAGHFLAKYSRTMRKEVRGFSENAIDQLMRGNWPGNIRELDNIIQRAVAMCEGDIIEHVPGLERSSGGAPRPEVEFPAEGFELEKALKQVERGYIERALGKTGGNLTRAADLLGVSFRSLRYKVKKLGLKKRPGSKDES